MNLYVGPDWANTAATLLRGTIEQTVRDTGRCRIALSGGSTPGPILRLLCAGLPAIDAQLAVTWVDERHPEASNVALAREAWLDERPPGTLLPLCTGGSLTEDLERFRVAFERDFGGLDVVLLGCGPDGHIASVFPGHPSMDATGTCFALTDSPKPPPARISLTLEAIESATHVVLVAKGGEKAGVLARANSGDTSLPLGALRVAGRYDWVLDEAAAKELE